MVAGGRGSTSQLLLSCSREKWLWVLKFLSFLSPTLLFFVCLFSFTTLQPLWWCCSDSGWVFLPQVHTLETLFCTYSEVCLLNSSKFCLTDNADSLSNYKNDRLTKSYRLCLNPAIKIRFHRTISFWQNRWGYRNQELKWSRISIKFNILDGETAQW